MQHCIMETEKHLRGCGNTKHIKRFRHDFFEFDWPLEYLCVSLTTIPTIFSENEKKLHLMLRFYIQAGYKNTINFYVSYQCV